MRKIWQKEAHTQQKNANSRPIKKKKNMEKQ